jgi:hypothetical protein
MNLISKLLIEKIYRSTTINILQQIILKLWTEIPTETCENLVQTMSRRIKTLICSYNFCQVKMTFSCSIFFHEHK